MASQATTNVHVSGGNLRRNDNEMQTSGGRGQRNGDNNRRKANKHRDRLCPTEEEEDDLGEIILLEKQGIKNKDVSAYWIVFSSPNNIFVF